ncbi:OsmC family protein [Enterobacter asburiae]|uniref:OsmC family protein n=1 Tax=Enterobacter asburiae TaxID=61645 RepID=UPI0023AF2AE4|nr:MULTISPECIES: OsmC family protein [Enterobacteriaceae]
MLVASAASCYVMTLAAMMDARKLPEADITVETTLTGVLDAGLRIAHDVHIVFDEKASAEEIQRVEVLVESADSACMVGNLLRKGGVEVTVQGHLSV